MTIKLTKELPTEEGLYYFKFNAEDEIEIVAVADFGDCLLIDNGYFQGTETDEIEGHPGYWAKVDQSMFEVVDDE